MYYCYSIGITAECRNKRQYFGLILLQKVTENNYSETRHLSLKTGLPWQHKFNSKIYFVNKNVTNTARQDRLNDNACSVINKITNQKKLGQTGPFNCVNNQRSQPASSYRKQRNLTNPPILKHCNKVAKSGKTLRPRCFTYRQFWYGSLSMKIGCLCYTALTVGKMRINSYHSVPAVEVFLYFW